MKNFELSEQLQDGLRWNNPPLDPDLKMLVEEWQTGSPEIDAIIPDGYYELSCYGDFLIKSGIVYDLRSANGGGELIEVYTGRGDKKAKYEMLVKLLRSAKPMASDSEIVTEFDQIRSEITQSVQSIIDSWIK